MDDFLTSEEAAAYLGVSRATLYAYVSRGLVVSEPGETSRRSRYPRTALERLRAERDLRRDPAQGALRGGIPVLESALTLSAEGRLWYRGRDAVELSRTASLEQVAALLWTGEETVAPLFPPQRDVRREGPLADRLVACLVERRAARPLSLARGGQAVLREAGRTIAALFAAAGAAGDGALAERLAAGWGAPADDLRAALVLCADHELNASAFTARTVASTDAPIANVLLAALCALEGRRHGGASRELDDLLADVDRLGETQAFDRALARGGYVPGLSHPHPLYPHGDPRANELLRRLALPDDDPVARLMALAADDGGSPSIELALAALARLHRLPRDAAFTLFALGRSVGWVAHALEAAAAGTLIRPRARYVGPTPS